MRCVECRTPLRRRGGCPNEDCPLHAIAAAHAGDGFHHAGDGTYDQTDAELDEVVSPRLAEARRALAATRGADPARKPRYSQQNHAEAVPTGDHL